MAEQFYTILTAIGKAKIANSAALGEKVELTHLALGDGDGSYYNPTEGQTELKNEVWRGAIGTVDVDTENPNWITIQTVVPSQHGGFMIREAGVFDNEGDLIAVGKYPETYKPVAADGSIKDLVVRMILEVSNTASVVLKVDPTVVLATQQQVIEAETRAKNYTDQEVGQVSQALDEHLADYASFKTDVGSNVKLLELNFLDLLIARELESLSTEMDAGYWWDTLQDATKIQNVTGATVSGGKIITTATSSEVVWRVHEIGFLTDKITFFMNRTKTTDIAPVDTNAAAGDSLITVKAATITIS